MSSKEDYATWIGAAKILIKASMLKGHPYEKAGMVDRYQMVLCRKLTKKNLASQTFKKGAGEIVSYGPENINDYPMSQ